MEVKTQASTVASRQHWVNFIPLLIIGWLAILFAPTFSSLAGKWVLWAEGLSHGFLVIAIFLYLVAKELPFKCHTQSTSLSWLGGALLASLSVGWAVFALIDINLLAELSLVGCLYLAIAYLYGFRSAWRQRFLLAIPIFVITLWDHLNGGLVNLSGLMVGEMVALVNIPAVIDGNSIFIPFGHIVIADGCSGLRYFVIALAMAYLISYFNGYSEKGFITTLLCGALLALATNWLRIFILIIIGYQSEMESALMTDHEMFGWLLFGVICFPALYFAPVLTRSTNDSEPSDYRLSTARVALTFALLAIGPLTYWLVPEPTANTTELASASTTITSPKPRAATNATAQSLPHIVLPADTLVNTVQSVTQRGDTTITINQYRRSHKGQKLVPYLGSLYDSEAWRKVAHAHNHQSMGNVGASILRAKASEVRVAQLQWFQVGQYTAASTTEAKLLQIPAILRNQNTFKIFTLQAPCSTLDCEQAFQAIIKQAKSLDTSSKGN